MKHTTVSLIFCLISSLTMSQVTYLFEKDVFGIINKNKAAKANGIKAISYFSKFTDSLNKGVCSKMEVYDSDGLLINEIFNPRSKNEIEERRFVYDSSNNLIEIHRHLLGMKDYYKIIFIGYSSSNNINWMCQQFTADNHLRDTLWYYYLPNGRYDCKFWGRDTCNKMNFRYNICGTIANIKFLSTVTEKYDSNDCLVYSEFISDGELKEHKNSFGRMNYDSNCNYISGYYEDNGSFPRISYDTSRYNGNFKLIQTIGYSNNPNYRKKSSKKFRLAWFTKYEYNSKGLLIFQKEYDKKKNLESTLYIEYEYR